MTTFVLAALMPVSTGAALANLVRSQPSGDAVSIELDPSIADARLGDKIAFTSTIRNASGRSLSGLIAHLNILSSDPDVYVDPEDWSTSRTRFLKTLPAGRSAQITWNVQAVTTGPFIIYVAVTRPSTGGVAVSDELQLSVSGPRGVDASGVLPLVVGMPTAILVLLVLVTWGRRQRS